MINKLLLTGLGGALSVIVLLVGSWMQSMAAQVQILDQRTATMEQHYAAIQADLTSMKQDLQDVKDTLSQREGK